MSVKVSQGLQSINSGAEPPQGYYPDQPQQPHYQVSQRRQQPEKENKDQVLGHSRGGLGTKVHLVCDAQSNPVRCALAGGQAPDAPQACPCCPVLRPEPR